MKAAMLGTFGLICMALWCHVSLATENFPDWADTDAIKAFLHENLTDPKIGIVVGLVDEHGSRIVGHGKLDGDNQREMDGDTVFEIGSITKTFTALVLQDMVDRGELNFDDPVAKYLPDTVKVPSFNGHEITLLHLATQSSGLPFNPDNFSHQDEVNTFADYSADRLYAFLSGYSLRETPGTKFSYSNVGMGLLGHVLSRRAGQDYESLIVDRICRPLHLDSTCITVTPELKSRLAQGHDASGKPTPMFEFQALAGTGALRSTANDLLIYVSAQLGLTQSKLTPSIEKTHVIRFHTERSDEDWAPGNSALPWVDNNVEQPPGTQLLGHGGGTPGFSSFIGFDTKARRGVVVLLNQQGGKVHAGAVGWVLLQQRPLTPEAIAEVLMHGREVVGIGAALDVDPTTHLLRITKVFPNSPALDAGLGPGQLVQKIDDVSTAGKPLADCVALIRGPEGSKLHLELLSNDGQTSTIELTRHKVKL